ncbi:cystathionine gamma-synthase [Nesterenkonia alkaliphila]|uniref:Cystathionine gamma-synthase n=1 Tax=Nesterenkonia alkaliphila TaxID=1463631 RepID=A0A7K1ULB6_9MICC|nr:cystathionine gamma-synthase [Nesterenkonia alkaliphila]MVT27226.1 cystathionine gamma-synthase [Nesterenkonia alkaliphila]GFZ78458.1 cystathionine gamma-synthase [Nesterenkonia alkaliphila]
MSIDTTEQTSWTDTAAPVRNGVRQGALRPGFATDAVHAGQAPDPLTGAVIPPIYQTSTFTQDGVETLKSGYEYSRGGNPTRNGFETQLAALEGGAACFAFASGIAAEDALLRAVLRPGYTVVAAAESYGGTHRLLTQIYARWGVRTVFVHPERPEELEQALDYDRSAKLVWLETPTNPLLTVVDIAQWAQIAHAHGALVAVDNTFASPALQTPLALGADAVVHSTTKYIGGHSDVLGGAVVVGDAEWEGQPLSALIGFQQFAAGAVAGPQDSFLAARGLKTLGVRIRQHCANAAEIADWLTEHPQVDEVFYPGLPDHRTHQIAAEQMSGFGGLVTFRLRGGEAAARRTAESTELFGLSVSLGGVESLISHPATMTHGSTKGTPEAPPADVLRLSVGIEDVEQLVEDLDRALAAS